MSVSVELESDEALVLFELLASRKDLAERLGLQPPERNVICALEAALEKILLPPFQADYCAELEAARKSVLERHGA
jgi:hypothetical protein